MASSRGQQTHPAKGQLLTTVGFEAAQSPSQEFHPAVVQEQPQP